MSPFSSTHSEYGEEQWTLVKQHPRHDRGAEGIPISLHIDFATADNFGIILHEGGLDSPEGFSPLVEVKLRHVARHLMAQLDLAVPLRSIWDVNNIRVLFHVAGFARSFLRNHGIRKSRTEAAELVRREVQKSWFASLFVDGDDVVVW